MMGIEKIEMNREIRRRLEEEAKEKKTERVEKARAIQMCKKFNEVAEKLKSKYRMKLTHTKFAHLYYCDKLWFIHTDTELKQMYYHEDGDRWSFIHGLSQETFRAIQPILEGCDVKFEIELNEGKVPAKYKIIDELTKGDKNGL